MPLLSRTILLRGITCRMPSERCRKKVRILSVMLVIVSIMCCIGVQSKKTTRESSSKRIRCNERKLNVSVQEEKNVCNSCEAVNSASASVCERCGYFLAGAFHAPLSMAQSRGLVAAPKPISTAMKDYEWESIEKELTFRQDSHCPICMEGFNRGYEVLLSCSHMYHRSCLQSFEKFMKTAERSCPICRTTNYQKKITVSVA